MAKSTTAALIAHVLTEAGTPTELAGNIGRGVLDLDPPADGAVIVLELSSYQTELARALTPDIAVFTNLSPDHLDRHGGMGGYFAAKRRLFSEGGPDRAIVGVDEPEGRFLANQLAEGPGDGRLIRVSAGKLVGPGWDISTRKGWLSEWRKGRQIASIDLRAMPGLPGAHNQQNAACAYAAVRALGLAPRVIEDALASFRGLPHRSQRVAEIGGVSFVNDSKATNVDAAIKALSAFPAHPLDLWRAGQGRRDGGALPPPPAMWSRPMSSGARPRVSRLASAMCPKRSAARWRPPSPARRPRRSPATRCCSRPRRRASTSTTISRNAAMISSRRSASSRASARAMLSWLSS